MTATASTWRGATDARRCMALLFDPAAVVELRAPKIPLGSRKITNSGYYADHEAILNAARAQEARGAPGVYVTMNPVNPALLARSNNHSRDNPEATTGDNDILARRWLFVDVDPKRPAGISATDAEHTAALERAVKIAMDMAGADGWPAPAIVDSGNGAYLLYRIDLPADDKGLIGRVLAALGARFDDAAVTVDPTGKNAARIIKLVGTLAQKGDSLDNRPHRRSTFVNIPEPVALLTAEQLEKFAGRAAPAPAARAPTHSNGSTPFGQAPLDLAALLAHSGQDFYREQVPWSDGRKWVFSVCPFNPEHTDNSAWVAQFASGKLDAGCSHHSCAGKNWHDLRAILQPGWKPWEERRTAPRSEEADPPESQTPSPDDEGRAEPPEEEVSPAELEKPGKIPTPRVRDTDVGNSLRIVARHGADLRYCAPLGGWFVWDGTRWQADETEEARRRAMETVRGMFADANKIDDPDERARLFKHALRSESAGRIAGMLDLAHADKNIATATAAFDTDPFAFSCANGTLDLHTGALRPHAHGDLITKRTPVAFDADAKCPLWEWFLLSIMNQDAEMVAFLQRAIGYSLTGDTREDAIFFMHGGGDNGKSTMVDILHNLLGDYGIGASFDTFLIKKNKGGPSDDLASLRGSRFVTAPEAPDGERFDERLLKELSGGDLVTCRSLYCKFFSYRPCFKIWFTGNHRPTIRGTDNGIWRRLKMIPFKVVFHDNTPENAHKPEHLRKDPLLPESLITEMPGILAWAVRGCLDWQRSGLCVPLTAREANKSYRTSMDSIGAFLEERCIVSPNANSIHSELYRNYADWAKASNEYQHTTMAFGIKLEEREFLRCRTNTGAKGWKGVSLKPLAIPERFNTELPYNQ